MAAATKPVISAWFDIGLRDGATYMIIVCDTFDHEDYPVYCTSDRDVLSQYDHHNGHAMQCVMEVYDLRLSMDDQLREARAWHLPTRQSER